MTDLDKLRAFAQRFVDESEARSREVGVAGASTEIIREGVAQQLLALLDSMPGPTDPARIPPAIREGLDRYHRGGIRPGHCLMAILVGDLFEAFRRADPETSAAMPAIVAYIRGELPVDSWGTDGLVGRWIAKARS